MTLLTSMKSCDLNYTCSKFKVQSGRDCQAHVALLWRKWSFTYFSWILAGGDIIQHFCLNIIINVKNTETSPRLVLQTLLHFWWVMRGRSVSLKRRTDIKQFCVRFLTPVTPSQLCAANRGLAGWRAGWHGTTMSPLHANPALVRHHATHSSHATCFLKEAKCE